MLNIVEEIISDYPIEIQNYYNPKYARILLDKIGAEDENNLDNNNINNEKEEEEKGKNLKKIMIKNKKGK